MYTSRYLVSLNKFENGKQLAIERLLFHFLLTIPKHNYFIIADQTENDETK